jgi:hypothetical protein
MGVVRQEELKPQRRERFAIARAVLWATLTAIVLLGYVAAGLAVAGVI